MRSSSDPTHPCPEKKRQRIPQGWEKAARMGNWSFLNDQAQQGNGVAHRINKNGFGLLHTAAEEGQTVVVEGLLALGADANARANDNTTPLHRASASAKESAVDIVRSLLSHGADVNARTTLGLSPLHNAVTVAYSQDVVATLLDAGAGLEACDAEGKTALHRIVGCKALYAGATREMLLSRGASRTTMDKAGNTPLHEAVVHQVNAARTVERLLACGANPCLVNKKGCTPYKLAKQMGDSESAEIIARAVEHQRLSTMVNEMPKTVVERTVVRL